MALPTSLTRWALAAAGVSAAGVIAAWALSGGAMFSPGALRAARGGGEPLGGVAAHVELARQCGACHAPPFGGAGMEARCLACHADVRAELGDTTALHGVLPDAGECLFCHTEHHGPLAGLTDFSGEGFDHARLGFSLAVHRETAEGRPFACSDCHTPGDFRFREPRCLACHRDYQAQWIAGHVREWGRGCQGCHEGTDRFTGFRHDTTAFRLTGRHVQTQCAACHAGVRAFTAFANAPPTCIGCHRDDDEHRGRFGTDCAACHNTGDWGDVDFDHTFPLDHGGQGTIACATCHRDMPGFRTYSCYGCHEHAPARIREEHLDEGITDFRNCAECHPTGREREGRFRRGDDDGGDGGRGRDDGGGRRGRGRGGRG
jgi:hypothetical protein